jgi:hypothetical protein
MVFGRRAEVLPGQLYRKMDSTGYVFEVMSVRNDPLGAIHVQLRRRDEPSTRRTLAASIILDPNEFELLQDVPGGETSS